MLSNALHGGCSRCRSMTIGSGIHGVARKKTGAADGGRCVSSEISYRS
jgi:hypothetical protein